MTDAPANTDSPQEPVNVINILQTTTGKLTGTNELRIMNCVLQKHNDYVFGTVTSWSRFIPGAIDVEGNLRPDVKVQAEVADNTITCFLRGGNSTRWRD